MKSTKILNIIIAAISLVGVFLFIRVFSEDEAAIKTSAELQNSIISPLISFSLWLGYITVGVTVLLSIWTVIRNPENLKKMLIGIGALGILLIIAYSTADSETVYDAAGKIQPAGEGESFANQWSGTGIWYAVFLGGIASLGFVVDLVKGFIKS